MPTVFLLLDARVSVSTHNRRDFASERSAGFHGIRRSGSRAGDRGPDRWFPVRFAAFCQSLYFSKVGRMGRCDRANFTPNGGNWPQGFASSVFTQPGASGAISGGEFLVSMMSASSMITLVAEHSSRLPRFAVPDPGSQSEASPRLPMPGMRRCRQSILFAGPDRAESAHPVPVQFQLEDLRFVLKRSPCPRA
jgi:hypothetical protein